MADKLTVERVPLASLVEAAVNPNTHPPRNLRAIRDSLEQFGQVEPLVVQRGTNRIIGGHGRLTEMRGLGWTEADIVFVEADDRTADALSLALNQTAKTSLFDVDLLAGVIQELQSGGWDVSRLGWDKREVANLLQVGKEVVEGPELQLDRAAELQREWGTELGQVWEIPGKAGVHRIMCGDSMDPRAVAVFPRQWDCAVIDPPFEVNSLPHFMDPCVIFGQAKHVRMIPQGMFRFERVIDKGAVHRSATTHVGQQHAFVVQCGSVKVLPDSAETFPSIVRWEDRSLHRHEKPVALLVEHLSYWMPPWRIVFDPFLGSGTTLIAAEQLGRVCYGMEIIPAYIAVTLQRAKDFGLEPRLLTTENADK